MGRSRWQVDFGLVVERDRRLGEFVCVFVEHECSIAKGSCQVLSHAELEEKVSEIRSDVEGEGGVVVEAEEGISGGSGSMRGSGCEGWGRLPCVR